MFDLDKVPFAKAFPFLASVLPGFSLLYLYEVAHTGTAAWFFSLTVLGYKSKVALFLFAAFVLGYSLNKFLAAAFGAVGGAWGATKGLPVFDKHPYELSIAPWRDKRWRSAYARRFGEELPQDLLLLPKPLTDRLLQEVSNLRNDDELSGVLRSNAQEMLNAALLAVENDKEWRSRYLALHIEEIIKRGKEFEDEVGAGLDSNLTIASLVVMVGWIAFPQSRILWLLSLASCWFVLSLLATAAKVIRLFDPWSTLKAQIDSLNSPQ